MAQELPVMDDSRCEVAGLKGRSASRSSLRASLQDLELALHDLRRVGLVWAVNWTTSKRNSTPSIGIILPWQGFRGGRYFCLWTLHRGRIQIAS